MFSILLKTAKDIVNSVICTAQFSENFNRVFFLGEGGGGCIPCKKTRTGLIIRIFSFNKKKLVISLITFDSSTCGESKLSSKKIISHKTIWHTSNIKKSEFK